MFLLSKLVIKINGLNAIEQGGFSETMQLLKKGLYKGRRWKKVGGEEKGAREEHG